MSEEVGFKPVHKCPACGKWHEVEYQYRGIDILVCPQMTDDDMVLMHSDYARDELERLGTMGRIKLTGIKKY